MKQQEYNKLLLILYILTSYYAVFAKPASGLYGVTTNAELLKIDPHTFDIDYIGDRLPNITPHPRISGIDNQRGIFYFVGHNTVQDNTYLIGLALENGTQVISIRLPFGGAGYIGFGEYCDVDPHTGEVIIAAHEQSVYATRHLLRVNPHTESLSSLNTIDDAEVLGGFSTYDYINNIEYFEVYENASFIIYVMDAKRGTIRNKIKDYLLESLDFDSKTGYLYGIGLIPANAENDIYALVALDGNTGMFKYVNVIPGYYGIASSVSTIDVRGRRLFVFLSPVGDDTSYDLVTINIDNGNILYSSRAFSKEAYCPYNIQYYNEV